MATYSIDTAEAIKHLKQNGFEEKQAEAIVQTFGRTQDDFVNKHDLNEAVNELRGEMKDLRIGLTERITETREDLSAQMSSQLKWIIGTVLATFLGVVGLLFAVITMFVGGAG